MRISASRLHNFTMTANDEYFSVAVFPRNSITRRNNHRLNKFGFLLPGIKHIK